MTTIIDHHRRSIRLRSYDYSRAGAYFVTVCSWDRECRFGEVIDGEMRLNDEGEIVREEWLRTERVRKEIELGEYVVMPNHIHGIIRVIDRAVPVGATRWVARQHGDNLERATRRVAPTGPGSGTVGAIIGQFKSIVTKRINIIRDNPGGAVWQRNYYEHIIRDEADYDRITDYVVNNPLRWSEDSLHPSKTP